MKEKTVSTAQMERHRSTETPIPPRMLQLMSSMYLTQYLGIGFVFIGATTILRSAGMDLQQLSLLTATGTLWAIKFLWAPLVDRYGSRRLGHYRAWILAFQAAMVCILIALAQVTPTISNYPLLLGLVSVFVLCSATQDIAADGLVLRTLSKGNHGVASSIQIAAGYLGNVIGGGAVLVIYQYAGWGPAVYVLALLTAGTFFQLLWAPKYVREAKPKPTQLAETYKSLITLFADRNVRIWALLLIPSSYVAASVTFFMMTPALTDLGWSPAKLGITLGVITGIPATAGAIGAGWLIQRFGARMPILWGGIGTIIATAALIPTFRGYDNTIFTTIAASLYMAGYAVFAAGVYTVNMRYCRAKTPASDFTTLNCIAMFVSYLVGGLCLAAAEHVGYTPVACCASALLVVGIYFTLKHLKHGNFQQLTLQENHAVDSQL